MRSWYNDVVSSLLSTPWYTPRLFSFPNLKSSNPTDAEIYQTLMCKIGCSPLSFPAIVTKLQSPYHENSPAPNLCVRIIMVNSEGLISKPLCCTVLFHLRYLCLNMVYVLYGVMLKINDWTRISLKCKYKTAIWNLKSKWCK